MLVCCCSPDGGIWASTTMVEAAPAAAAPAPAGAAPTKTAESMVDLLFRERGLSVASPQASPLTLFVYYFSVPNFCFCKCISGEKAINFKTIFLEEKKLTWWWVSFLRNLSCMLKTIKWTNVTVCVCLIFFICDMKY